MVVQRCANPGIPTKPEYNVICFHMFPPFQKPTQHAFYMTTTTINWPSKETTTWLNSGQLTLILSLLHSWFWMGFCALRGNRVAPNRYLPGYWGSKWSSVAIVPRPRPRDFGILRSTFPHWDHEGHKGHPHQPDKGQPKKFTHHLYIYILIWRGKHIGHVQKPNKQTKIDIKNMFV